MITLPKFLSGPLSLFKKAQEPVVTRVPIKFTAPQSDGASEQDGSDFTLYNITVLESDRDVVRVLMKDVQCSWVGGPEAGNRFTYDYIQLFGEDKKMVDAVAIKILALSDIRDTEAELRPAPITLNVDREIEFSEYEEPLSWRNEVTVYDVELLESDKSTVLDFLEAVHATWVGNVERGGKYYFEHIYLYGDDIEELNKIKGKIEALHAQRTAESHERALATIVELGL